MIKNAIRILALVKNYWKELTLSIVFKLFSVIFSLSSITMVLPFLSILFEKQKLVTQPVPFSLSTEAIMHNFNYFISQIIIKNGPTTAIAVVSGMIVGFTFLKSLFQFLTVYFTSPVRMGVVEDLRNKMYKKILDLPVSFYSNEKKGDLITRVTSDAQEIEISVVSSLEMLFFHPITILVYVISLIWISPRLTLIVFLIMPLIIVILGNISKVLRKRARQGQRRLSSIISIIDETLFGLKIIKAFNAESMLYNRFSSLNRKFTRLMVSLFRRRNLASPLTEFLASIIIVAIMWYGSSLVLGHYEGLSAQAFIGYMIIFSQVISPAKGLSSAHYNVQKGMASLDRIEEILNIDVKIVEKPNAILKSSFNDKIEYRNVSFRYRKDIPVLKNINLTIPKGYIIAIVGQSGSGKTTMVDLLPRFFDVTEGGIYIDGIDIRDVKLKEYRNLFGIVSQEPILFNDTFFNNIAFGKPNATLEEVERAAKIANAYDFIKQTSLGFYTNIGERGNKLSGGQRQRISIARAVLKNPPILILDEATSSLDSESEKLVQKALDNLMKDRTTVVIAHRLSTIINSDLIVVINEGEIVEKGKHDDLIKKGGFYKKYYDLQMFS